MSGVEVGKTPVLLSPNGASRVRMEQDARLLHDYLASTILPLYRCSLKRSNIVISVSLER
jgi:hypothetical protein